MLRRFRSISLGDASVPIFLLVLAILAYGLLLPSLGFYWDDWPNAWFFHILGPAGFPVAFATDRPVIGYFYLLTTPWLRDNPIAWQAFALACRALSAITLWWVLRLTWPEHRRAAAWVAVLFLVYPSFQQQHISVIYSHFFLLQSLHFLSLALMLLALTHPRRRVPLTVAALLTQAVSLFSFEYSISLEVLRPITLWVSLGRNPGTGGRTKRFLQWWSPYLALTLLYLVWRVAVLGFPTYQPGLLARVAQDPAAALTGLGTTIVADVGQVLGQTWLDAAGPPDPAVFGRRATLFVAAAALAALIAAAVFLLLHRRTEPTRNAGARLAWSRRVALIGLVLILAGGAAAWITELPIGIRFPWDRLSLPMILGACLVIVALVNLLPRPAWTGPVVLAVLTGLAVASQVEVGFSFRRDWEAQRDFFWQLAWRAPAIAPGTVLLTNNIPLRYESDNSLTGPLNWIYADALPPGEMAYMLYFVSIRLGLGLPALAPDLAIDQPYRATRFHGNTSQSLAILSRPPGCLQVLDETYHDSMATIPRDLSPAVPLASLDWIDTEAPVPEARLIDLFGPEPAHNWCYYFEKADLARQRGAWQAVADLGEQGVQTGDRPNDASEWVPFIEANARLGELAKAEELSRTALDQNAAVRPMLCRTWGRLAGDLGQAADRSRAEGLLGVFGCD